MSKKHGEIHEYDGDENNDYFRKLKESWEHEAEFTKAIRNEWGDEADLEIIEDDVSREDEDIKGIDAYINDKKVGLRYINKHPDYPMAVALRWEGRNGGPAELQKWLHSSLSPDIDYLVCYVIPRAVYVIDVNKMYTKLRNDTIEYRGPFESSTDELSSSTKKVIKAYIKIDNPDAEVHIREDSEKVLEIDEEHKDSTDLDWFFNDYDKIKNSIIDELELDATTSNFYSGFDASRDYTKYKKEGSACYINVVDLISEDCVISSVSAD